MLGISTLITSAQRVVECQPTLTGLMLHDHPCNVYNMLGVILVKTLDSQKELDCPKLIIDGLFIYCQVQLIITPPSNILSTAISLLSRNAFPSRRPQQNQRPP